METQSVVGLGNGESFDLHNNTVTLRDNHGRLVTMDLGAADVHTDAIMTQYISGYRPADMVADVVAPPVIVTKPSNYFFQFEPDNALQLLQGTQVAPGGDPPQVQPAIARTQYNTLPFSAQSILPTELIAAQDAPLKLQQASARLVMDKLMLNREYAVATAAFTSGSYASSNVVALSSGAKWNGGASSDPIANIKAVEEASLAPITHMVMALPTWNAFIQNPAVQKYVAFKSAAQPLPTNPKGMAEWASLLDLPIPVVSKAKYKTAASTYSYVWGGSVALVRSNDVVDDLDIATFKTFRWNGAGAPSLPTEFGGTVQGGFTVRSFFNPFKGARGSTVVIVVHNDAITATGGPGSILAGGLITGAYA